MNTTDLEAARERLENLHQIMREGILQRHRGALSDQPELARVVEVQPADVIYGIDRVAEEILTEWFASNWPADQPMEVIAEGLPGESLRFPSPTQTPLRWKCLIDPIDGTRCFLQDKRSAWILSGLAPADATDITGIEVAVMTELPPRRQDWSDQISARKDHGKDGVRWHSHQLSTGVTRAVQAAPAPHADFDGAFASVVRFFPEGKSWLAELEEDFWRLWSGGDRKAPVVFDDQYLSTGGQFYEIARGADRMIADLRPLAHHALGLSDELACHPYDVCGALILAELGAVIETPWGDPLRAPFDTTSPVSWIAYANAGLAAKAHPIWRELLSRRGLQP